MEIIGLILGIDNNDDNKDENGESITRYLKLEATFILANLSSGDEYVLDIIFDPKYKII